MGKPYHPLALANEFIMLAGGQGVSHMKLQKLVYCAHGWWLQSHYPDSIVSDEPEVWKHGPVFPKLYRVLSGLGGAQIKHLFPVVFGESPLRIDDGDIETAKLIQFTWARYGGMTPFELSDMTHKKGTPWQLTAEKHSYRVPLHTVIPLALIRDEFVRIATKELDAA